MSCIQQELDLFPVPTFEEIISSRGLSGLSVVFRNRLKKSWSLTIKPDKQRILTIPGLLEDAPERVKKNLIDWALIQRPRLRRNRKKHYQRKKILEESVWRYLEEKGIKYERALKKNPEEFSFNTRGSKYDLQVIYEDINTRYFGGKIKTYIRWGRYASKTSYQSFYTDNNGKRFSIITIAGVYDHPKVPEFAVRGVLFHEMLHIAIPSYKKKGRNIVHGIEFKRSERSCPYYKKWHVWEKKEFYRIARLMKKKKK